MNAQQAAPRRTNGAQTRLGMAVSAIFKHEAIDSLPVVSRSATNDSVPPNGTGVNSRSANAPTPFHIEWAAGFADGEACLHIAKQTYRNGRPPSYRLRVCITQNNLEVLEHFMRGMQIQARIHRVARRAFQNRQCYTLNYDGVHAMALIAGLRPHLVRKRPEADAASDFWIDGKLGCKAGPVKVPDETVAIRERYYRKMQSLK